MDIDPDHTNGIDDGAVSSDDDDDYRTTQQRRRKRPKQDTNTQADDEARDNRSAPNLHPDDPGNFLKLCTAIKILVSRTITEEELVIADKLIREYCLELVTLYGPEVIRPNHHYATHTSRSVRNYGPLHEFWTFLFERLNKVLKSYKTSNHAGGELETSFFREFQRTVQQTRLLAQGTLEPAGSELRQAVQMMYDATADDRGTVQALARDLDAARLDDGVNFQLSIRADKANLPPQIYASLLRHLRLRLTNVQLHSYLSVAPSSASRVLLPQAFFFDHVVIKNRRYLAHYNSGSTANSLIGFQFSRTTIWVGELCFIFAVDQESIGTHRFGYVRWLKPTAADLSGTVWGEFAPLTVQVWTVNEYLDSSDNGPDSLINLEHITCHVVRDEAVIRGVRYWVTITAGKD
ncbi:hypothetical protein C8J57DRAFT_173563 [Mycena rebaudengoi]|nr:hypothetical protein C8J57DRAFT_173563 [Mycena rebaudengoi]